MAYVQYIKNNAIIISFFYSSCPSEQTLKDITRQLGCDEFRIVDEAWYKDGIDVERARWNDYCLGKFRMFLSGNGN